MTNTYHGYTESDEKVQARWQRWCAEADADYLHELMVICDTDPAHVWSAPQIVDGNSSQAWFDAQPEVEVEEIYTVKIPGRGIHLTQKGLQKYYNQRKIE